MAISVKPFASDLDCQEPLHEIQCMFDATSASTICNGGGTNTSIFSDQSTLANLYSGSVGANAGTGNLCDSGMDVVFLIDYTSSMTGAINGVKSGVTNLINTINTESGGNYRLGLVLFDGNSTSSPDYATSGYYQGLPGSQKIVDSNPGPAGGYQYITCVEKMSSVGNSTSFTNALNAIDATTNSSSGMVLGGNVEAGGLATYQIAQNQFAGSFRSEVLKLIILITDDGPEIQHSYFTNTIIPACSANDIQVFVNTSSTQGHADTLEYADLANNTTPAGNIYYGLSYANADWVNNGMVQGIQDLCEETFIYSCEPATAGWYAETPIVAGTTIVYYWDGTAWTNTYTCPIPTVRYTLDIIDSVTGGSPDAIATNHPYYNSATQFIFNAAPGTQWSVTVPVSEDSGYENLNLTATGLTSNPSANLAATEDNVNNEVTITGTVPSSAGSGSVTINGAATQIQYSHTITVLSNIDDSTDVNNNANTGPNGECYIVPDSPATGWVGTNESKQYTFTGVPGATLNFTIDLDPNPSDYTLSNLTGTYSGVGAVSGDNITWNLSNNGNNSQVTGTLTIPTSTNAQSTISIVGQSNQPSYRYILNSTETITGASIASGEALQAFNGYTGDEFNFEVNVDADSGYNENVNVAGVGFVTSYGSGNGAISDLTVDNTNDRVTGTITMPEGGDQGGISINGSATATVYSYTVTFVNDSISGATWPSITLTGVAGSTPTASSTPTLDGDYTYNVSGASSNSEDLSTYIVSSSSGVVSVTLSGGMPIGGGSAIVTMAGGSSAVQYTYTVNIVLGPNSVNTGSFETQSSTVTGAVGSTHTGSFNWQPQAGYTYNSTGISSSQSSALSGSLVSGNHYDTNWSLTMPSGGGDGTLTVLQPTQTATQYTFTLNINNQIPNSTYTATHDGITTVSGSPASIEFVGVAGATTGFTVDLDPTGYNVIDISTVTTGGSNQAALSGISHNESTDVITGTITMPVGGGNATIIPKGTATVPTRTFTFTAATNISNTSIAGQNTHTISAPAGSTGPWTHTFDVLSDSGYGHNVTGTTITSSYGGVASASPTVGEDLQVTLTEMPANGGSVTATANGTNELTTYTATINFTESIANAAWTSTSQTVTGVLGQVITLNDNQLVTASGYEFMDTPSITTAGTSSAITDFGSSGWATVNLSRNFTGIEFTMPEGGGTFTVNGFARTRVAAAPEYTLTYNANGGGGVTPSTTGTLPITVANNNYSYSGYAFNEWNTISSGTGAGYAEGAAYNTEANATLYAIWDHCVDDYGCMPVYSRSASNLNVSLPTSSCWNDVTSVTINGGAQIPVGSGLQREIRNVPSSSFTLVFTYANGCSHSQIVEAAASPTTTSTTTITQFTYSAECVSGGCLQGTGTTVQTTTGDPVPIGAHVTLEDEAGCWEILSETNGLGNFMIDDLCTPATTTTSTTTSTSTTTERLRQI